MTERTVVPIDWPVNPWPTGRVALAVLFLALACWGIVVLFVPDLWPYMERRFFGAWAFVSAATAAGFIGTILLNRSKWRRQRLRIEESDTGTPLSATTIEEYLHRCRVFSLSNKRARKRLVWEQFRYHVLQRSLNPPRTVVDSRINVRFHSINGLPEYFLEVEEIPVIGTQDTLSVLAICVIAVVGGASLIGLWPLVVTVFTGPAFVILVLVGIASAAPLRRFLIAAGRGAGRPLAVLASPGVLDDQRGHRWVSDEATMFVRMQQAQVEVLVMGPGGQLFLTIDSATSGEFIALWQRWNHPHPRPELV